MVKLFKLTDENGKTMGDTQWGVGVTHEAKGDGTQLCSDGFIHAYESPLVAAFIYPQHVSWIKPRLWEADAEEVVLRDGELKCGVKKLTTVKEIPLPELTTEQKVEVGIRCALQVYAELDFVQWAEKWLKNIDRSKAVAEAAARAAEAAARAAEAAARAAEAAAEAAARAAEAAAWAAAEAARAAWAAAEAARAAWAAAEAAAWAAEAAARAAEAAARAAEAAARAAAAAARAAWAAAEAASWEAEEAARTVARTTASLDLHLHQIISDVVNGVPYGKPE